MKSLALFLITIVLIIIGMRLLSSEYVEAGLGALAVAAVALLFALVINHHEHTRR